MKNIFRDVFILTIVSFQLGLAGDLVDVYKDYFPENTLKLKSYRESINTTLNIYASIDPSLIYYYITHLELKINQKIADSDSNFSNIFQAEVSKAKLYQKNWAQLQIDKMHEMCNSIVEFRDLVSYFSPFLFVNAKKIDKVKKVKINPNLRDYFIYLYFLKKENIKYDPLVDYKELYINQSNKIVHQLNSSFNNIEKLNSSEKEALLSKAYEFIFLFKGTYLKSFPITTSFTFYELLIKMFKDDNTNKHSIFLKVSDGIIPTDYDNKFEYIDNCAEDTYTYNHKVKYTKTTFLNLGFKIALKKPKTPFSVIKVGVGYSINQLTTLSGKDAVLSSGLMMKSGLRYKWYYAVTKPRDFKSSSLTSQVSLPVYYYSNNIFFEIGLNYTLRNYQYTFDFIKQGECQKAYEQIDIEFDDVEEIHVKESKHSIYPILAANIRVLKYIHFRAEYFIPLKVRYGVAVHVPF